VLFAAGSALAGGAVDAAMLLVGREVRAALVPSSLSPRTWVPALTGAVALLAFAAIERLEGGLAVCSARCAAGGFTGRRVM
jgi:hypothetical protein